jgi:hypothetical protein
MSTCRTCGVTFEQSGRGRPRLDCLTCRPPGPKPSSKVAQNSAEPVPAAALPPARNPLLAHHRFKRDDHPTAWRWCRHCGLSIERHPS